MMQHQPHVPKFGNWENGDNGLYTAYFDNARKGKTGGKMINPNDPQQNPEFFGSEVSSPSWENKLSGSNHEDARRQTDFPSLQDPVVRKTTTDPHHQQRVDVRESSGDNSNRPVRQIGGGPERRGIEQSQRAGGRGGTVSSPLQERKSSENNHGLAQNTGASRMRSPIRNNNASTIPRLGDWDENDPSAGEGYTGIFERVREERLAERLNVNGTPPFTPSRQTPARVNRKMQCCFL